MFNERDGRGGLFHYGARSEQQRAELAEMYNRVQPTHIYLNKRREMVGYGGGLDEVDFNSLWSFFEGYAELEEIPYQLASFAVFLDNSGMLQVTNAAPGPLFDATNIVGPASLNQDVSLLVNMDVYSPTFSTGAMRL